MDGVTIKCILKERFKWLREATSFCAMWGIWLAEGWPNSSEPLADSNWHSAWQSRLPVEKGGRSGRTNSVHRLSETVTQVSVFFLSCKGITMESKDESWPASSTIYGSFCERTFFPCHGATHSSNPTIYATKLLPPKETHLSPTIPRAPQPDKETCRRTTPAIISLTRFPRHSQAILFTPRMAERLLALVCAL